MVAKAKPEVQEKREWGKPAGKTKKLIHAYEMLEEIEAAEDHAKKMALWTYGKLAPLNFLLSLNFRSDVKLDLPEGMPPLNPKEMDNVTHPDLIGQLSASVHRLKNCVPGANLKQFKKEQIFTEVLLSCPLKDAEIVCSCKDKALYELYPSITPELVKEIFPDYVK
jgi:hypothetical protein